MWRAYWMEVLIRGRHSSQINLSILQIYWCNVNVNFFSKNYNFVPNKILINFYLASIVLLFIWGLLFPVSQVSHSQVHCFLFTVESLFFIRFNKIFHLFWLFSKKKRESDRLGSFWENTYIHTLLVSNFLGSKMRIVYICYQKYSLWL